MILTINKVQWEDIMKMYVDTQKTIQELRSELEKKQEVIDALNKENVELVIENSQLRADLESI